MTAATQSDQPATIDVSHLESYAFGPRSVLYWGMVCLCLIEGTAMMLLLASYLYVRGNFNEWPPSHALPLVAGPLTMGALLASLFPMWLTGRAAAAKNLAATQRWQLVSTVFGFAILGLRAWEIHALPFNWSDNAYASIVWTSIGFHTVDCLAEMGEMVVLTALVFKGPLEKKHFEDVEVNAFFWGFLVLLWLPFACLFYGEGSLR